MNEKINIALLFGFLVMTVLFCFLAYVHTRTKEYVILKEEMIDYWRHKTDSCFKENIVLWDKYWDLKDSLITIKYGDN